METLVFAVFAAPELSRMSDFRDFETFDPAVAFKSLPLHTSPVLARFESSEEEGVRQSAQADVASATNDLAAGLSARSNTLDVTDVPTLPSASHSSFQTG